MDLKRRKNPRLKGFDYSLPHAYFITICCKDKKEIFTEDNLNKNIINCLLSERKKMGFKIFVYCLMKDHIHFIITPPGNGQTISDFTGRFKSVSSKVLRENSIKNSVWQGRFYDHVIRRDEDFEDIVKYVLNNPVRKGIVQKWEDYKYCGLVDSW